MKLLFVLLFSTGLVAAQSHPQWWTYATPTSTALVGIQWANLRGSFLAPALLEEIGPGGSLGFPDLPCLNDAQQILISAPDLLAIASGACPAEDLRTEAAARNYRPASYRGFDLWVTPGADALSIAVFADRLLFLGKAPVLRDAIDRTQATDRAYTRLLARAAVYAKEDLWVVAERLPDPLASLFVPLDSRTRNFEGSVSVWDGLHLVASINATGIRAAETLAASIQESMEAQPALLEGSEVTVDRVDVYVRMDVSEEQLAAATGTPPAPVAPAPVTQAPPPVVPNTPIAVAPPPPPPPPPPVPPKPAEPAKPSGPKIVRIYGIGDRPVELPLK